MSRRLWAVALVFFLGIVPVLGQNGSFDKLDDADRAALRTRFEKDVWPLMSRGGKGGDLRLRGMPGRDFDHMLKEGFFIPNDAGSILGRVVDKDKKRQMPPPPRAAWTEAEISVLREFVTEVAKKQKK
jgi:hypothetical protein